jgi:hypothetical protein
MPAAVSVDAATTGAIDVIYALLNLSPASPLSPQSASQVAALHQLTDPEVATANQETPAPLPTLPVPLGFARG